MTVPGYVRLAAAVPHVALADVKSNVESIKRLIDKAEAQKVNVLTFPELCITGYSCGDLFGQRLLIGEALEGLLELAAYTEGKNCLVAVGLPVLCENSLYNCAALLGNGDIKCIVPKTYLPNYQEFYERRWFASGEGITVSSIEIGEHFVDFGTNCIVEIGDVRVGVEICEDLWVPIPPSSHLACSGANVILNLSATDELIGKHRYLLSLISQQSARCRCAYVYASAGPGESSTDLVYSGNAIIASDGSIVGESPRFTGEELMTISDVDIEKLMHDRQNSGTFHDCSRIERKDGVTIMSHAFLDQIDYKELRAYVDPMPFVPSDRDKLDDHCAEILNIQAAGLAQRLRFTNCKNLTIGISGGLDSTLALLVAVRAFDQLGLDRKGITGITMPGFGTTDRTHSNSWRLMEELGVTALEIPIGKAVEQHFSDIGHDGKTPDVTYENSQARMRTLILMDYANKTGGMVLGTGDLSELALGWCTYNGDHMSMYAVNASVPKTLVRHLVEYVANTCGNEKLKEALLDISATPISPELLPSDGENISQKTEDLVGPYELHDFFLYQTLRYGFTPEKVLALALRAYGEVSPQNAGIKGDSSNSDRADSAHKTYSEETIIYWLKTFYRRFFNQQFKRSCMPDGPKTGSVCLSPRGDWRMPSDASSRAWLASLD